MLCPPRFDQRKWYAATTQIRSSSCRWPHPQIHPDQENVPYSLKNSVYYKKLDLIIICKHYAVPDRILSSKNDFYLSKGYFRQRTNKNMQCCGSWIFIPDPNFSHPGSLSKNLSILTQKITSKLSEIWFGLFIPDPDQDPEFVPIPDPGSRGQKGTGSRIRIRNTEKMLWEYRFTFKYVRC